MGDPQGAVWVGLQPGHGAAEPAVREGLLAAAPAIGCHAVTCRRRQSDNEFQNPVGLKPDPQETSPHDKTVCCNSATQPPNALTRYNPFG